MHRITVSKRDCPVFIKDMPIGSYGVAEDQSVFYRTNESAACLNCPGRSFISNAHTVDRVKVILIPPGSSITIRVGGEQLDD